MKKTYSDFILNEQDSSTAVAPSATTKVEPTNTAETTKTINPDVPGEEKTTVDQEQDDTKKDDSQKDEIISNFDETKGEEIIKEIRDFWINKIITENELNFSGNTLKILYVKQKNSKYIKYKDTINEVIASKTAECNQRLIDSDVNDMFFYVDYPIKLIKKGLTGKPSIVSFFNRQTDEKYNSKIKEIISNNEYADSSGLPEYQKKLVLGEFELLTDIDEKHTYMYDNQPVEFTFENGAIKTMVNADTNNSISLVDKNDKNIFDITKLKKYDESAKSDITTNTTTVAATTTNTTTVAATTTNTTTVAATTTNTTTIAATTTNTTTIAVSKKNVMNSKDFKNNKILNKNKNKNTF